MDPFPAPHDDVEIRPLTVADAAAWRALRLEALRDHPTAFLASHEEASRLDVAAFAAALPVPPSVLFGLFVDGGLAGSAGLMVREAAKVRHKGLVWGFYLAPSARGRGLGRRLLAHLIARAPAEVGLLQLNCLVGNESARRLYAALGFRPYGVEVAALRVGGVDYDDELMWLPLPGRLPASPISDRRAP